MATAPVTLAMVHEVRDRCLCLATQRAARRLARRFDIAFMPVGLTNGQFSLMMALSAPRGFKRGELAAFLGMDRTTVTAAIKALARRGLVAIEPDAQDRRMRRPVLTDAGHTLLALAVPLWRQEHAALEQALPPFTGDMLRTGLRHID